MNEKKVLIAGLRVIQQGPSVINGHSLSDINDARNFSHRWREFDCLEITTPASPLPHECPQTCSLFRTSQQQVTHSVTRSQDSCPAHVPQQYRLSRDTVSSLIIS